MHLCIKHNVRIASKFWKTSPNEHKKKVFLFSKDIYISYTKADSKFHKLETILPQISVLRLKMPDTRAHLKRDICLALSNFGDVLWVMIKTYSFVSHGSSETLQISQSLFPVYLYSHVEHRVVKYRNSDLAQWHQVEPCPHLHFCFEFHSGPLQGRACRPRMCALHKEY